MLKYVELKAKHRAVRESFTTSLSLRTHRALSWLNRAEQEASDDDARFLFLWIAFNAAYANELPDPQAFSERRLLVQFLNRLVKSDKESLLHEIVWHQFSSSIRMLIDNKFVFQPFWDYQSGKISENALGKRLLTGAGSQPTSALGRTDTTRVLAVIFDRLYTLRNQISPRRRHLEQRCQPRPNEGRCQHPRPTGPHGDPPDDGDTTTRSGGMRAIRWWIKLNSQAPRML